MLMKDSDDANFGRLDAIENDVFAMLVAMKAWAHRIASSSYPRILNEYFEAALELRDVSGRLIRAPGHCAIPSNFA
jgi:hypothetical protein